jgi:hypothetical protein
LVVADTAGFVLRDHEVGESGGGDLLFADGAFASGSVSYLLWRLRGEGHDLLSLC